MAWYISSTPVHNPNIFRLSAERVHEGTFGTMDVWSWSHVKPR